MTTSDLNIETLLPVDLADETRVWIYQAESNLTEKEVHLIDQALKKFIPAWQAHGKNLKADFRILFNRFVCLFVDESAAGTTGCSIDSSVRFIQNLEKNIGKSLMQRTRVVFIDESDKIDEVEMNEMSGRISGSSLVFNNLVPTLGEMRSKWLTEARNSWHSRML